MLAAAMSAFSQATGDALKEATLCNQGPCRPSRAPFQCRGSRRLPLNRLKTRRPLSDQDLHRQSRSAQRYQAPKHLPRLVQCRLHRRDRAPDLLSYSLKRFALKLLSLSNCRAVIETRVMNPLRAHVAPTLHSSQTDLRVSATLWNRRLNSSLQLVKITGLTIPQGVFTQLKTCGKRLSAMLQGICFASKLDDKTRIYKGRLAKVVWIL